MARYGLEENQLSDANVLVYDVIQDGRFNMELCLTKFAQYYEDIYREKDITFVEEHGRMLFLIYLRPLINGKGFYHIESQFTDLRRMDIVVDYADEQFIIELKIWHGNIAHEQAYEQLAGYLESKHKSIGYLLTFDLRKAKNRNPKSEWVEFEGKKIFDCLI
jgi:hypothetical protein